ncbi:MAG: S-layer homology domain-containing protein [Candidatus Gastranaerophilales bacterium]|nr:S-layer homology domain-containing protein [Candidatus Gastranaerophilales bacterium]
MFKKFAAIFISFCIIIMHFLPVQAAGFNDVQSEYWAYGPIQSLGQQNIITGYLDNTFRPDNPVSRAEFATMMIKAINRENTPVISTCNFKDLSPSFWAYNNIQRAYSLGLISGFPGKLFKPNDYILKVEVIAILSKAIQSGLMSETEAREILNKYYDSASIPAWAMMSVAKAVKANLIVNYPQPNFLMPQKRATRAEVATMLYNLRLALGLTQPSVAVQQPSAALPSCPTTVDQISQAAAGGATANILLQGEIAIIQQNSVIPTTLVSPISSEISSIGDPVTLNVSQNITTTQGVLLIPAGSQICGTVTEVIPAKFGNRNAKLTINFNKITLPSGCSYPLSASIATESGSIEAGSLKGQVLKGLLTTIGGAGAGAALGTALGAITGKTGKGAIYGTAIGGGLGAVGAVMASGGAIKIPSGEPVFIKLNTPLTVDTRTGTIIP